MQSFFVKVRIRTVNKPSYLERATLHTCCGYLSSNISGERTAAWRMGEEMERFVTEESRQNYGSFFTNALGKRLYRNTSEER